jgi:hypothetical protein
VCQGWRVVNRLIRFTFPGGAVGGNKYYDFLREAEREAKREGKDIGKIMGEVKGNCQA